jgi:succinate dehydrogenase/fumarate reductase flavoprotein subunit
LTAVVVGGAGMGGLVAAARLRELGVPVTVLEKGHRPGGSMLLSSGVVWRHRSLAAFREECPGGDPGLQEAIIEQLDDRLDWLEAIGAPVVRPETGNPRTTGRRFDPRGLTDTLVRKVGDVSLGERLGAQGDGVLVLATGGFGGAVARRLGLPLRANPRSVGDGLGLALGRGAALTRGMDEFYGRALPAPPAEVGEADFVRASQLFGSLAHVVDDGGTAFFEGVPSWHENDLVQAMARRPGGTAWYVVGEDLLDRAIGGRTVREMIAVAEELGGAMRRSATLDSLGLGRLSSEKLATPPFTAVHVVASVTYTIGGIAVDASGRVLGENGEPLEALYAVGVDAGGFAAGGYSSGLAAALVLGFAAAEAIAASG